MKPTTNNRMKPFHNATMFMVSLVIPFSFGKL